MSHRINRGEWMADETSSLTVAKLKALVSSMTFQLRAKSRAGQPTS